MNKSELIELIAAHNDIPKTRAAALVNSVFEVIAGSLVRGEKVVISNFGTFSISSRKSYVGHNPRTGSDVEVPERRIPLFKAGTDLKNRMNDV